MVIFTRYITTKIATKIIFSTLIFILLNQDEKNFGLLINLWFSNYLAKVGIKRLFVQLNDNYLIACYNQLCNTMTKVNNFQKV